MSGFKTKYHVTKKDMDNPYRHLHHSDSLKIMEHGRRELMAAAGQPVEGYIARGILPMISRVDVRYKREIREGEVDVTCDSFEVLDKILRIKQRILLPDRFSAVQAEVDCVFVVAAEAVALKVPPELVEAISKIMDQSPGKRG